MTSTRQLAANRENARRSTGPKTADGKAIARLNAARHGGLSPVPVLPEVESAEAWEAHLGGTLASLAPIGHLETVLAERVALVLWRLQRLARYEREATAVRQERVVDDLAERRGRDYRSRASAHPDEVRDTLREARRRLRALEAFARLADRAPLSGPEADTILSTVALPSQAIDLEAFAMPEVVPDEVPWEQFDNWTAGRVRRGIAAMAAVEGTTPEALFEAARRHLRLEVSKWQAEAGRVERDLDHLRRERLLPAGEVVDRVARYEAHLGRQLAQALHELQRLQAARAGEPVTPPAVLDVTVSGAE
jgi:hypothetical protein